MSLKTDTRLLWVLGLTLAVKLAVAWYLPLIGDEAYFIVWGKHPDFGFYDHPPMVGWFLTAMLTVSDATMWLRLPQILITTFIGWAIYALLRRQNESAAVMAATLYLLAPVNNMGVVITTDTPLLLWSFLSGVCFYNAQRHDNRYWYMLSGLFLGLAFFSKFFAGLLGVAYFIYILFFVRRGVRPWVGLLWVITGTLPFIGLNLWWNYTHCWNNYLFNLYNRTTGDVFSIKSSLKYLIILIYLITPPVVYYLIKQQRELRQLLGSNRYGVFLGLFLIPYVLFLLLSFWVSIGLHWLFSFYPFVFLGIASLFTGQQLRRSYYFMLPFLILHIGLFVFLVFTSPGLFKSNDNNYKDVVYSMYGDVIVQKLRHYQPEYILATDSYTESALLSYAAREHVIVFGIGSHHARQDDMITDFRQLDGKNILLLSYYPQQERYQKYFESTESKLLPIAETNYHMLLGRGFKYNVYRQDVLEKILQRYYRIPNFLPVGRCNMYEWYGKPK
jgi:4-amino-4-deoxy-L-arabinose transferase-like glycosyltransferase